MKGGSSQKKTHTKVSYLHETLELYRRWNLVNVTFIIPSTPTRSHYSGPLHSVAAVKVDE